ncbi:MAG: hypothetical protein K0R80_3245 [Clostridia bacterium]|nr:hypothetical protein [Clostridia bacterium]
MRSSRIHKKRNKKLYLKSILLTFLVIIPATAIISSMVIYYALNKDKNIDKEAAVFTPVEQAAEAFKYSYDINVKQLYRVEIKKFEEYEDAEAQIAVLKNKKVNGFIVKEQGYLTAYGLFGNKSQADTAAGYLKRKNIESTVNTFDISGINIKYDDMDKNLINIASAVDSAVMKQEAKLVKYLNYLQDIKTSEANAFYKKSLEDLIKELLVDKLQGDGSYDYYELQNSMMNQGEALKKFYEKSIV